MRATAISFLLMSLCPIAYAEPVKLTDAELDAVTAGAVYVSADAWALAIGDGAYTEVYTDTQTGGAGFIEWGFGQAKALACCGPQTDADVSLDGSGDGPFVAAFGLVDKVIGLGNPQYTTATGFIYVISIDPGAPRLLRDPQKIGVLPWANSPLIGRLVRPQLSRPVDESSAPSTSEGTSAYALATSDASGLSAAVSDVFTFTATAASPDFSGAAATSVSFRDSFVPPSLIVQP